MPRCLIHVLELPRITWESVLALVPLFAPARIRRTAKKERYTALHVPGERARDLVDNRGSITDIARAYCCRCLMHIGEQPRELDEDRKATANKVGRSSNIQA
eukprot:6170376-Pyramimonas_sp.AAC.1